MDRIEVVMTLGKKKFKYVVKSVSEFTINAMAKMLKRVFFKHKDKNIVDQAEEILRDGK